MADYILVEKTQGSRFPPESPGGVRREHSLSAPTLPSAKIKRIVSRVFHRNGRAIHDFRGAWQKACEAAGVLGRLVHDFWRTAARNLESAGVSRSVAMKLTGHLTESIYRRYAIVSRPT